MLWWLLPVSFYGSSHTLVYSWLPHPPVLVFWYSDQNPLSCFSFFLPEGSCNYWALWIKAALALKRGFDHIRSVFGQGFITIPVFSILRGVCVCVRLVGKSFDTRHSVLPLRGQTAERSPIKALCLGCHWIAYIIAVQLKVLICLFLSNYETYSSAIYLNDFNKR